MVEWKGVNPNNYDLKQELGTLTVKPVEIVLIQNCVYGISGNITIETYGLKAQVNDVDDTRYDVARMGENRWWLQFEWGDKIEAQIVVVTDETSYTITPVYDFVLGDSGNYKINTVDATGEFDVPPVAPLDGFGMGNPSGSSSVADSSLDAEEETSVEAAATESATIKAAPAPVGSDPDVIDAAPAESAATELSREEDRADEDAPEEPSEDVVSEPSSDEEAQELPPEEEPSEEEPSDEQDINI